MATKHEGKGQVDETGRGVWCWLPVSVFIEEGSTFTSGNPGGFASVKVADFPGVGVVTVDATVRLKQPKAKASPKGAADAATVAAAVLAELAKLGVVPSQLAALHAGGAVVTVPAGVTGSDLAAGRAAVAVLAAGSGPEAGPGASSPSEGEGGAVPGPSGTETGSVISDQDSDQDSEADEAAVLSGERDT